MASTNTAMAPSFGPSYTGGGGKRERDGDDRRDGRRDGPRPVDKEVTLVALGPKGWLRLLIMAMVANANLGNLPSGGLLTAGGQPKTYSERSTKVGEWVTAQLTAPEGFVKSRFSEMAEAFVHIVRAVNKAGLYDQLVALLVEVLTDAALDDDDD